MKIILQSTNTFGQVNDVRVRLWEGKTDNGIPIFAYVACIAVHKSEDQREFETQLEEHVEASALLKHLPLGAVI